MPHLRTSARAALVVGLGLGAAALPAAPSQAASATKTTDTTVAYTCALPGADPVPLTVDFAVTTTTTAPIGAPGQTFTVQALAQGTPLAGTGRTGTATAALDIAYASPEGQTGHIAEQAEVAIAQGAGATPPAASSTFATTYPGPGPSVLTAPRIDLDLAAPGDPATSEVGCTPVGGQDIVLARAAVRVPNAPQNVKVTEVTSSPGASTGSATIEWTQAPDDPYSVLQYVVSINGVVAGTTPTEAPIFRVSGLARASARLVAGPGRPR